MKKKVETKPSNRKPATIPRMTRKQLDALSQRMRNMTVEERLKENYDDYE
jgi:hypothetical protein